MKLKNGESGTWGDEVIRYYEAFHAKFKEYGYDKEKLVQLASDLAGFYGACIAYQQEFNELLGADRHIGVHLATLDAWLKDAKGHLNKLVVSLPKFHRFVSESDDKSC